MVDLAFAISSNAAGAAETFQKIKDAIDYIVTYYGADRIRYAFITFGSSASEDISFQDMRTVDELRDEVDLLSRPSGVPNLREALLKAKDVFSKASDRPEARKFLVVIMDTKSSNVGEEITQGGEALEKEGIKVGFDVCYPSAIPWSRTYYVEAVSRILRTYVFSVSNPHDLEETKTSSPERARTYDLLVARPDILHSYPI